MVLRCYSRRHLVPCTRILHRQLSSAARLSAAHATTTSTTGGNHARAVTSSPQQPTSRKSQNVQSDTWSFFFPDHLPLAHRKSSGSRARHPLVKKLIAEIYSTSRDPAANRVWKAYMDLKESYDADLASTSTASSSSSSLLTQLEPVHLQQLLRAIDPSVSRTRKLNRVSNKRYYTIQQQQAFLATGNAPNKIYVVDSDNSRRYGKIFDKQHPLREYMRRVEIIFRDMRLYSSIVPSTSSTVESLPSLADYNHVLSRLASGGHIGPMSSVWNDITGVSSKASSKDLYPDCDTYRELMIGLSRHATDQIERVQKGEASKLINYSGKKKQIDKSARAAAAGMAKFGQVLAPSARAAAILAALRTMALLKDMKDHAVTPNQITLDFAARSLRLAGHIDGLHLLMQQAYGINLSSPDSVDSSRAQSTGLFPTTHTLNTILMALGEQATVPEMVTAFETIAKPLPTEAVKADAASSGEGIFSTNWRDIFNSLRNRDNEVAQQGTSNNATSIPDVFPYSHPHRIPPNTKTFEVMLRHCCSEVDPLRSPVALKAAEASSSSLAILAKESTEMALAEMQDGGPRAAEMDRRSRGAYILFAKSLLSEALERSEELLHLTARNLGIDIDRTNKADIAQENITEIKPEHSSFSVTPKRAMDADFLPILESPTFAVSAAMVEPFVSLASARKSIGELRWIRSVLSKALEHRSTEVKVIDAAYRVYSARFAKARQSASSREMDRSADEQEPQDLAPLPLNDQTPAEVFAFLQRLRQQHRLAAKQAQALEQLLYDRLDERVEELTARRARRQKQRVINHREERLKAEKEKIEEEEREAARKKQVEEAKRLRALQKEEQQNQQGSADNPRSHLEAASTVSA